MQRLLTMTLAVLLLGMTLQMLGQRQQINVQQQAIEALRMTLIRQAMAPWEHRRPGGTLPGLRLIDEGGGAE